MPFAWMPWRAQSAHIARVSIFSAPFDAVYGPIVSRATSLVTEQMLTILPRPRSIICGATARATRNALVRFTSMISLPLRERELLERLAQRHARVVDEHVDLARARATPAATAASSVTSNGAATAPSIPAAARLARLAPCGR